MARYIELDVLVAEIEGKIEKYTKRGEESDAKRDGYGMFWGGVISCLNEVRTLCDTLEVKEVDLEKLINDYFTGWYFDSELDILAKPNNYSATVGDVKEIARHFFELGLKAQHSSIGIPNIDDIFEEEGIDPNSKDAKIFKECYYMALEKLKVQKGE